MIAQLELWNERKSGRYEKKVYVLPKHLDEKVRSTPSCEITQLTGVLRCSATFHLFCGFALLIGRCCAPCCLFEHAKCWRAGPRVVQ